MKRYLFIPLLFIALSTSAQEPFTGPTHKVQSQNKYFMHTGFTFDAVLKTAIFSFNTITPVIAETEYPITFLDRVIIPKGTKIIGECSTVKTIDRVNISFHTLVFPQGPPY